jgi:toxin YoeB
VRDVTYHPQMLVDLTWYRDHDRETGQRAVEMIEEATDTPEEGTGRPKRLAGLPNLWSRRINHHHRLNYLLLDGEIRFISCRDHDMPHHVYHAIREGEGV